MSKVRKTLVRYAKFGAAYYGVAQLRDEVELFQRIRRQHGAGPAAKEFAADFFVCMALLPFVVILDAVDIICDENPQFTFEPH